MEILDFCRESAFEVVRTEDIGETVPEFEQINTLNLSTEVQQYIKRTFSKGIYKHQATALRYFTERKNICLTTSTASGKSLVFYLFAIELLAKKTRSKNYSNLPNACSFKRARG